MIYGIIFNRFSSVKRSNGLWLWKPYIILNALERVSDGDYVFYCDSGAFFFSSVKPLIDSMRDADIWVSDIPYIEEQWTKPEVFARLGITSAEIKSSAQIQGSFVLARKSKMSCEFVREWLKMCATPELIKPLEPGEPHGVCIGSVIRQVIRGRRREVIAALVRMAFAGILHPQS